jgi:hypothetical protein
LKLIQNSSSETQDCLLVGTNNKSIQKNNMTRHSRPVRRVSGTIKARRGKGTQVLTAQSAREQREHQNAMEDAWREGDYYNDDFPFHMAAPKRTFQSADAMLAQLLAFLAKVTPQQTRALADKVFHQIPEDLRYENMSLDCAVRGLVLTYRNLPITEENLDAWSMEAYQRSRTEPMFALCLKRLTEHAKKLLVQHGTERFARKLRHFQK